MFLNSKKFYRAVIGHYTLNGEFETSAFDSLDSLIRFTYKTHLSADNINNEANVLLDIKAFTRPSYVKNTSLTTDEGIFGFFGEYRWLSNFHVSPVTIDGRTFYSSEAAYMSRKTTSEVEKDFFAKITSPREAKQRGQLIGLREDWEEVKFKEMLNVLRAKFQDEDLKQKLLATKGLYLEETNHWDDTYWGVFNGVGGNNLGKILMLIRRELI